MVILKPHVHAMPVGWVGNVVVVEFAGQDLEIESTHVKGSRLIQDFIPVLRNPEAEVVHLLLVLCLALAEMNECVVAFERDGFHPCQFCLQ